MKTLQDKFILGVDHGYGNIKTANHCFKTGILSYDCTPSLSQAQKLKQLSQAGQLDMDRIFTIMREPKANQQEKISFKVSELRSYFPKHYTPAQMMQEIILAVKERQQRLARQRNRDAR